MTNRSSLFKWKYEKLVDQEIDQQHQENLNLLGNKCDYNNDLSHGQKLLQSQRQITTNNQETIIPDLEFSNDYYELKKRSQKERQSNKKPDHHHYIFHRIEKGDTLQGIALKWYCSLHELKRVNNLVSDQDFHALAVIKIPDKKYETIFNLLIQYICFIL
ncbi:lysM and putative peptidoglycan-binding domain-containing protein 3-like [Panonychus citri]|uniref:lysM and putative peptidoglycan-binding domain-containing protein 3-like n=1 Tax=Panonychus citri TaxID=50023 RepID=UPI00230797D8|nr:lysM and putative peptidoglycan-binding domain-containing protein 3-like [Panonychus citri]